MSTQPENKTDQQPQKQIVLAPKREIRVVEDTGPLAYLFDTAKFEHMHRIASLMAGATLIPDHMWKDKSGPFKEEQVRANCFLVCNQAVRWGMDPFAVVPATYVVAGKLGFEGKLVAAVVNARAPIKHSLNYTFSGTKGKDDFTVTVSATLKDEHEPRTITLSVGDAKTDNKMWTKDPEQKLCYSGATKWARRHCPEIILGILTDDDLEHIVKDASLTPMKPIFAKSERTVKPDPAALPQEAPATAKEAPGEAKEAGKGETTPNPETTPKALDALMAKDKITAKELGACLKSLGLAIPAGFDGPDDLRDDVLAETLKTWGNVREIVLAERTP